MFLSVVFAVLIVIISVILWHLKYRHIYKHSKHIPGTPTLPIIGNALDIGRNPVDFLNFMCKAIKTYGPITTMWIGANKLYILIADPQLAEHLLSSPKYLMKSVDYNQFKNWLGNGLLISTGSYWQKRRKIITPTFHFKILEQFIPIFNLQSDILVKKLAKEVDNDKVDIYPYVTAFTLDVICETAMGTTVKAQDDPNNEYCIAVRRMSQLFIVKVFSFWKQFETLYKLSYDYQEEKKCLKILHQFTKSVIESRRKLLMQDNGSKNKANDADDDIGTKKRVAFLDLLLQSTLDGLPLSDSDIADEVDTFMFEGHDTTSSAISFAMYSIANNPDVQEKIVEELLSVFSDDINRAPTLQDLNNLKYIDCVVKETLRLYPSVPYYGRELEEDIEFNGKIYPKGAMMAVIPFVMHRQPNIFKNPEEFKPDRFSSTAGEAKHPFAYVPFSAGPRNCIGQKFAMNEIKSTIAKIVRNFELLPVDAKYKPVLSGEAILKSKNGIHIKLKKRNLK